MADDQQNPFTMMGMMGMMQPNKYINPAYRDNPLPMPGYMGTPTDAMGNPIQSYVDAQAAHDAWQPPAAVAPAQGTTLNSAPQPTGFGTGRALAGSAQDPAIQARINPGPGAYYGQGSSGFTSNQYDNGRAPLTPFAAAPTGPSGPQTAAPAAAAVPTNPIDMRQAYLTALSNPGPVTTQGATVPQSRPLGQPSVLDAFLSTHQGGPPAPAGGGYSNAGFFDTLNKLRSS